VGATTTSFLVFAYCYRQKKIDYTFAAKVQLVITVQMSRVSGIGRKKALSLSFLSWPASSIQYE